MPDIVRMQGTFFDRTPDTQIGKEGILTVPTDPLALNIEDDELVRIVDQYSDDYTNFYENKYNLFERRKKNEVYRFGRQIMEQEKERLIKDYESRYMDNVLYEIEGTVKPLVMSRLPDLMVLPENDSEEAVLTAQEISKALDDQIKNRISRRVLGLATWHLPVYFTAVIKCRWDPEIDDFIYENIHPDLVEVDSTCTTNDADQMMYISQIVPLTVKTIIMKFPSKKEKFLKELKKEGLGVANPESWSLMATTINIREVWFDEYIQHDTHEVEKVSGLLWKYKGCILGKMKNPNFDYTGEKRYFSYDPQLKGGKRGLNEDELNMLLLTGQLPPNVQEEQVYHNYFRFPRKPYYFFGYDQWGKQPFDETSRIEQNLANQKALDKRGKQLEETLDQRGHNIFGKESGLTPADIEELDMNDPDEDLVVDGNPNDVHKRIEPERPSKQEFDEMTNLRNRMYAVAHSNAVRGQIQSQVATTNQIAREADYTSADDLAEETINDAAQWMAEWAMQMIKLRYTKDHFREALGIAGEAVWIKLNRNMIADGMIVKIKASGTDKIRAENNALEMAKTQLIDPYTFYIDMHLSDPEGRTERLILAKTDPVAYLQKVVKGLNTSEALAMALMNAEKRAMQPLQQNNQLLPQVPNQPPTAPAPAAPPAGPSPMNTGSVPVSPPAGPPQGSPRIL